MKETLEEASWKFNPLKKLDGEFLRHAFKEGAKWQKERMYSEEEVLDILDHHTSYLETFIYQYIDRQDIEVMKNGLNNLKKNHDTKRKSIKTIQ